MRRHRLTTRLAATRLAAALLALLAAHGAGAQAGPRTSVLDPNTAGEKELAALGLTPAAVKTITDRRPFLSQSAFDAALAPALDKAQRTALYPRLFVQLDLNTAPDAEILMVPGVGPRMLHEFKEYRPYTALAQFRREIGKYVKEDEVARLAQYVFVPIDLNSASDEDILSIPGVGRRMLHEFKEYRPYTNIQQFRREIGKYVDAKEVARLERYVTIRTPARK
jgi:DNA uptake protein ComE-like DNA-binding protein